MNHLMNLNLRDPRELILAQDFVFILLYEGIKKNNKIAKIYFSEEEIFTILNLNTEWNLAILILFFNFRDKKKDYYSVSPSYFHLEKF